jgi:hypothetical protein
MKRETDNTVRKVRAARENNLLELEKKSVYKRINGYTPFEELLMNEKPS